VIEEGHACRVAHSYGKGPVRQPDTDAQTQLTNIASSAALHPPCSHRINSAPALDQQQTGGAHASHHEWRQLGPDTNIGSPRNIDSIARLGSGKVVQATAMPSCSVTSWSPFV
jgi:hypothetical protein